MAVRPIFVVGSPRTGTTMIGNYIGSAKSVLNAGEYRALYLAFGTLPLQLKGALTGLVPPAWEPYQAQYVREVQQHAAQFIVRAAESAGCTAFCDSSPRNVLVGPTLAHLFPEALFVLTLRHYSGTIQSLQRLGTIALLPGNEPGIDFVDPGAVAAAVLWNRHYQAALQLPRDRTVVFGYDGFCADPDAALDRFKRALNGARFPISELDDNVFATSHATLPGRPRAAVGHDSPSGPTLTRIPSYDAATWSPLTEFEVDPVVSATHAELRARYPDDYGQPTGYPGRDALLRALSTDPGPTEPGDVAESRGAGPTAHRSGPGDQPAP
ncbi:MAG: sulfotransferase [Candidatus Dormiibacterota bacterium]